jgi:hypothetical protein
VIQQVAPAIGYVLLSCAVLWPAVVHFGSEAMVGDADGAMFRWLWWSMPRALDAGEHPLHTELVFHPVGADLTLTTFAPLVALVSWPVRVLFGPIAQINAVQLGAMFLAGWGGFRLALHVSGHHAAAFLAGVAYALLPARFVHVDEHLNLVAAGLIPLVALAFLRVLDAPSRRGALVLGGWLGCTFLVDPQLAILSVVTVTVLGAARWQETRLALRQLAGAAALSAVIAAPLLVPMASALVSGGVGEEDTTAESFLYSASPVSWLVPPADRLWISDALPFTSSTPTPEGSVHPGFVVLVLAVAALALAPRARRTGWLAVALVGAVLSLGPYPFVGDRHVELPLPFFIFRAIPGVGTMRVPGRFGLVGGLGLVVLAAVGLAALLQRRPRWQAALPALALVLLVVELWPAQLRTQEPIRSEVYEVIRQDDADGAVLELPLKWSMSQGHLGFRGHDEDFRFLLAAIVHERPIVSGAVSRFSDERLAELLYIPTYRQLLALGGEPGYAEPAEFTAGDLHDLGISFVVYHRSDPAPRVLDYLKTLDLEPLAADDDVIAYRVPDPRASAR